MCSGRPYESTDMQYDLSLSGHDLDLRSNFQNDLLMSNYGLFDASQNEKYDSGKMNVVSLLSQKLLEKNLFRKKRLFLEFLLYGAQTIDLRSNLRACGERALKDLSNAYFRGAVALLVP